MPVLGSVPLCSGERLVQFSGPSPLSTQAVTSDWPRFNGPGDDAKSIESPLLEEWPEGAPRLLWSLDKGYGYASPAVCKDILVGLESRTCQSSEFSRLSLECNLSRALTQLGMFNVRSHMECLIRFISVWITDCLLYSLEFRLTSSSMFEKIFV